MSLLPPSILGTVTALTTDITVQGQTPGPKNFVVISISGGPSIRFPANTNPETFHLPTPPPAKSTITVHQEVNGESSPESKALSVDFAPSVLGDPVLYTPVYGCAECLEILGEPGAQVTLTDSGTTLGGPVSVPSHGANVIFFMPKLASPTATMTAPPASPTSTTIAAQPAPLVAPLQIQSPVLQSPISECQPNVTVSNLLPGTQITVFTDGVTVAEYLAYNTSHSVPLPAALRAGQVVTVSQAFPKCQLFSKPSAAITVTEGIQTPGLIGRCFEKASRFTTVYVTNAKPGAQLIFEYTDGSTGKPLTQSYVGYQVPTDIPGGALRVDVGPIPDKSDFGTLEVKQGFDSCLSGHPWSDFSNKITIDVVSPTPNPPDNTISLVTPLYEHGEVVHVMWENGPYYDIRIFSTIRGEIARSSPDAPNPTLGPAGQIFGFDVELTAGEMSIEEEIFARVYDCAGLISESVKTQVLSLSAVPMTPPEKFSYTGGRFNLIKVFDAIEGFIVQVGVGGVVLAQAVTGDPYVEIPIDLALAPAPGSRIQARHVINGTPTAWSMHNELV